MFFQKNRAAKPSEASRSDKDDKIFSISYLETQIGPMVAIADEAALYLLEFADRHNLKQQIESLKVTIPPIATSKITAPIESIALELDSYFRGELREFKTSIKLCGTAFQHLVWQELISTPYAETRSYQAQARAIGKDTACRAVARANGANRLSIIVPCHRIISSDGSFGGYSSGIARKKWLIAHEKKHSTGCRKKI